MWPVSSLFLQALTAAPVYQTTATYTVPGGGPVALQVQSGQLTVDSTQSVRRQASLVVEGDSTIYQQVMIPGTIIAVKHGVKYGNTSELVPIIYGEVTTGVQDIGGATITLSVSDMTVRIIRNGFINTYTPSANTLLTTVIANVVTTAVPGTTVVNTSSYGGTVPGSLSWTTNGSDVITDLSKDGAVEAFFQPDGSYLIRDLPVLTSPAVWTTTQFETASRTRPMDQLINTVAVRPAATDGSQTWTQQVVAITDTNSPIHTSKIGPSVYIYSSSSISSSSQAIAAGTAILSKYMGSSESLGLGAICNPALECSDVIAAIIPQVNQEPPQAFQHFVDAYMLDIGIGSMTLQTRTTQLT